MHSAFFINKCQHNDKWNIPSCRSDFLLSDDIYFMWIGWELKELEGFGEIEQLLEKQDTAWGNNTGLGESIKKFGKSNIHVGRSTSSDTRELGPQVDTPTFLWPLLVGDESQCGQWPPKAIGSVHICCWALMGRRCTGSMWGLIKMSVACSDFMLVWWQESAKAVWLVKSWRAETRQRCVEDIQSKNWCGFSSVCWHCWEQRRLQ